MCPRSSYPIDIVKLIIITCDVANWKFQVKWLEFAVKYLTDFWNIWNFQLTFRLNLFKVCNTGVRRSIDVLDPENQPGSGALGPTEDVWHQKYELRKDFFYLKYSFNRISIISLCSRYRVLDWNLAKNPNPWKKGTHLCRLVPQHGKDEDLADVKFSI